MFNRRYALIGWLVWTVAKQIGQRKAKSAVPRIDRETRRPNPAAIASAFAALAGTAWLLGKLKRREGSNHVAG